MQNAYQKIFKSKSRFRSTFLILATIALWMVLPYFIQFGSDVSHARNTNNLPDLVAVLSAPPANPTTAVNGIATYDVRTFNGTTIRELRVNVQEVNAPAGTVLRVFLNANQIGTMTLGAGHNGSLFLTTLNPNQTVPQVVSGNSLSVKNGEITVLSGTFAPPTTPSPTVTPSHTPTGSPNVSTHLFAQLTGSAINGIVPRGLGTYESENGERELKVFVNYVNLPNNTILNVMLNGTSIGNITINNRSGRLQLETDDGDTVPTVTNGATLTVKNGGATILSGTFSNTPPTPTPFPSPTGTPTGTPTVTPTPNGTPVPHVPRAFNANLRGQNVVPPVTTTGRGHGFIVLNQAETEIRVHLGYFNLSSNATAITIKGPALAGANGAVVFTLTNPGGTSGRVQSQTFAVTAEQVVKLRSGLFYFNISTVGHPTGEIRGQIRTIHRRGDFDGDGFSDVSVLRSNNSTYNWYILNSSDSTLSVQTMGQTGDINVQGDYDGDGMVDLAMFTPSTGTWNIRRSATSTTVSHRFGQQGDVPVVGDYDGDGINDLTVFRPSTGTWYVFRSSDNGYTIQRWGLAGDKPVSGDFDGDGLNDLAVFRPSDGNWYIFKSSTQSMLALHWGLNGDKPVSGDFDGDGIADIGVFRPSNGTWYIYNTLDESTIIRRFGLAGDVPVACEYDGDGQTDIAVFRPSDGNWYIWQSSSDSLAVYRFGLSTDVPAQTIYAP